MDTIINEDDDPLLPNSRPISGSRQNDIYQIVDNDDHEDVFVSYREPNRRQPHHSSPKGYATSPGPHRPTPKGVHQYPVRIKAFRQHSQTAKVWPETKGRVRRCSAPAVLPGETSSSELDESDELNPPSIWNSTRRQKLVILTIALADLTSYTCLSLMAPFFPREASEKGISESVSGWIFGIFALTTVIVSPIYGKLMPKVGSRFMFIAGQFFAGGCIILFGLLDMIDTSTDDGPLLFTVFCFVLRISLSIGCSAVETASLTLATQTFPDNPATAIGLLETAVGVGLMIGPALGGVLYEAGGFMVPFIAMGLFMLVCIPIHILVLPAAEKEVYGDSKGIMLTLLKIPTISISYVAVLFGALIWVVLDPTLEPHLRDFNLSPTIVGLIFLMMSFVYAVLSPFIGWACDRIPNTTPVLFFGFIIGTVGCLLVGPSPLLGLGAYKPLWLILIALVMIAIAVSLIVVPTFDKILDAADKNGIEDNLKMYGAIAGMWSCMFASGEFIGPVVAGQLVQTIGFGLSMTYLAGAAGLMSLVILILWIYECKKERKEKSEKILSKQQSETEVSSDEDSTDPANIVRKSWADKDPLGNSCKVNLQCAYSDTEASNRMREDPEMTFGSFTSATGSYGTFNSDHVRTNTDSSMERTFHSPTSSLD